MRLVSHKFFPIISIAVVSLIGASFFIMSGLKTTHGTIATPLDDAFIHFQYAKQISQGNWFKYFPGAPISSGDTSFLYPLILAVGYRAGLTGLSIIWFAYALALACLVGTGYIIYAIGGYFKLKQKNALWIALLVISNGWLLWGYFSGMEIALQTFFLLATFYAALKEINEKKLKWLPLWLFLLTIVRPEGFIASALLGTWIIVLRVFRGQKITYWYAAFLPFLTYAAQLLFYHFTTGEWNSNTFILKTWWYIISSQGIFPYPLLNKFLSLSIVLAYFLPKEIAYFANDMGLISIIGFPIIFIGAIFARGKEGQRSFPLTVSWIILFIMEFLALLNIYAVTEVTRRRYFIFLAPLAIFFTMYAVIEIAGWFNKKLISLFLIFFTILSLGNTVYFARAYSFDIQNIFEMHFQVAQWVQKNTAPNDIIAMNDAGVVPYLTNRPFFDVMGLVTNKVARVVHEGPDAFLKYIISLPRYERPAYFIIFPGWFDTNETRDVIKLRAILKQLGTPIAHFTVSNFSIVPYGTMSVLKPKWDQ
ncbi:MAG: hypothetical protein UX10_C0009G0012 [Candidatus Magasanikbacteria bacterium GW2011_GWA2_45_39]|uniref:Glycosyltransferase RgtA/B/C/D-like domain-containing protein n=2 Tax=Candidatus Magasanikiibacteriota TaxID=1752731 RepID=A0A0G1N0P8_9BACT|nr:MAG: hypothetical protein UX10_C0009G0012 [Candidatus Magasanikbacteria bacterium GW2011_GWA2_45_39]KKU14186.1 MAG: hypothetical protein UX20_C0004G0013 [Candidatus Magasanikbacteria bacterium GW2011_GWC2_45_8]HBW74032.1 hypothetical protein [Candidatus Magasanikbacteria bacterium]